MGFIQIVILEFKQLFCYRQDDMGNQACTQCMEPVSPILDYNLNLHPDAPKPEFAYPRQIHYPVPCEINHLANQKLPLQYQPYSKNQNFGHDDLRGTPFKESYFIRPYSVYYTGEWKNGLPHGVGEVIFSDGTLLNGTFYEGKVQGKRCLYIMKEGAFYIGGFEDNYFEGQGEIKYPNNHSYRGEWHKNVPDGKGTQNFANGDIFTGTYQQGKKEGDNCSYQWANHEIYESYSGAFHDNYFCGYGQLKLKDGTIIKGLFRQNKITKGYLKNSNYEYTGDLFQGKFDGEGKLIFLKDNKSFEGNFKNGQMHGLGTLTYKNDKKIKGKWFRGIYTRDHKNISDDQLQMLLKTIEQVFQQSKFVEDAIEDLSYRVDSWCKEGSRGKHTVKQMMVNEVNKINNERFCVVEVGEILIAILA